VNVFPFFVSNQMMSHHLSSFLLPQSHLENPSLGDPKDISVFYKPSESGF